jgi:uncharacterized hydantoinase/oxoprolinase family protein
MSRTLPAKQLVGVLGLFIVTDEYPDKIGTLTLKKTARLLKSDSVNPVEKSVTCELWDGHGTRRRRRGPTDRIACRCDAALTPPVHKASVPGASESDKAMSGSQNTTEAHWRKSIVLRVDNRSRCR